MPDLPLREKFINSSLNKCRHFNGIQNKKCEAGVPYQEGSMTVAAPCLPQFINGRETWPCTLFAIMSREEAEKKADERMFLVERTTRAMTAVVADAESKGLKKGHGGYGEIACPACGDGRLSYSVASYNGHIHGRCSRKGCVSWMQ